MTDPLYTAKAHLVGGRNGTGRTDDGQLDLKLAFPKVLGGSGDGTNPEQLFAIGFGACFLGVVAMIARNEKIELGEHSLDAKVDLFKDAPTFKIGVTLTLNAPSVDRATAEHLLAEAHKVCPYSKATRGNVPVTLAVA